jgi:cytochrome c oxidase assembly factor CtaG
MTDDLIFIKAAAIMTVVFVLWMVWRSRPRKLKDWPPRDDY